MTFLSSFSQTGTAGKDNPIFIDGSVSRRLSKPGDLIQPDDGSDSDVASTSTETTAVPGDHMGPLPFSSKASGSPPPALPGEKDNSPPSRRFVWRRSNTVAALPKGGVQRNWRQQSTPSHGVAMPPPLPGEEDEPRSTLRRQSASGLSLQPQVVAPLLPKGAPPAPPPIPRGGFPPPSEVNAMDSKSMSSLDTVVSTQSQDEVAETATEPNDDQSKEAAVATSTSSAAEQVLAQAFASIVGDGTGPSSDLGVYETVKAATPRVVDDTYLAPTDSVPIHYDRIGGATASTSRSSDGYATIGNKAKSVAEVSESNSADSSRTSSLRRHSFQRSSARHSRKTPSRNKPVLPPGITRVRAQSSGSPAHTLQRSQTLLPSPQEEVEIAYAVPQKKTEEKKASSEANLSETTLKRWSSSDITHTAGPSGALLVDSGISSEALNHDEATELDQRQEAVEQTSNPDGLSTASLSRVTLPSVGSATSTSTRRSTLRGEHRTLRPQTMPTANSSHSLQGHSSNSNLNDAHYWATRNAQDSLSHQFVDRYSAMAERPSYDLSYYRNVASLRSVSHNVASGSYF